jgi:hypothetical protein
VSIVKMRSMIPLLLLIMTSGFVCPVHAQQLERVTAERDALLARHERSDREFLKLEIGNIISYFHQRMIGEAIVEKDFIRYQFDRNTHELFDRTVRWREGLPDAVNLVVTREQAESMASGDVQLSELYFISTESEVYKLDPTPMNPCWIVRSEVEGGLEIVVIDAMTGEQLGYGIPPPAPTGYSLSGPSPRNEEICSSPWTDHYQSAATWFEAMDYPTTAVEFPSTGQIQSYVQSDETALFYELAHGGSYTFRNGCPEFTTAADIYDWLALYTSLPFAFIGSCGGMCDQLEFTFSYEFRKRRAFDAVTVGYCDMAEPECTQAWSHSIAWQEVLFERMSQGCTIYDAFNQAIAAYPVCLGCMRFAGDKSLTVVPKVTRSLCGSVSDVDSGPLIYSTRAYYIRCDVSVPPDEVLTISPSVVVAVMFGSRITAEGLLFADGSTGEVQFLVDKKRYRGIHLNGQLRMMNGGCVRIYNE